MLENSSSSNESSVASSLPLSIICFLYMPSSLILISFFVTMIFILVPLSIFILYHGLQLWRQKRSTSSAAATSHSDCFTYHMVAIELLGVLGSIVCCCGIYLEDSNIIFRGFILAAFMYYGQTSLHVLTCAERYLAVVHPITYRNLRNERGIRIRNVIMICVWLFSFAGMGLAMKQMIIPDVCLLTLSTMFVFFCSLSVLCGLNRPGPGEHGGRERVGQSNRRAFYTILAILGVLVLRFAGSLIWIAVFKSEPSNSCLIMALTAWFNLPSSLVLLLLYLHKAGKLVCKKINS